MGVRNLHNDTKASLLAEKPFTYAHLIKFEKPLLTATGQSGRRPEDYVYLSDGSHDIVFETMVLLQPWEWLTGIKLT